MDPDFHLKKCRDCTYRVKDADPTNIGFKGMSHCRYGPAQLIFIAGMSPQGPMAQPVGSAYPAIDENMGACSKFESNGGIIRRNIVKAIPQEVSEVQRPSGLPLP